MDGETLTEHLPEVVSSSTIKIEDVPQLLSPSQIHTIVKSAWNEDVHVINFEIQPYSNEKLGFLSLPKCLIISVRKKDVDEIEIKKFFVKCIPRNHAIIYKCVTESGVFEQEISFYNQVVPLLEQNYNSEQWFPKCYVLTKDVMVFEDLRMKNFSIRKKILTMEETRSALSAIARMHAASILAEKQLNKPLNENFPKAFNLQSYYKEGSRLKWFRVGVTLTICLAEHLGLDSSKVKECCEAWLAAVEPSKNKYNVITHSDLWSNNIMFNNSNPPKCIIVDYQMIRYCPIAQDVIVFLHLCTNRIFRKNYQTDMLQHYYSVLTKTLRLHDKDIKVPTWAELLQGVQENTPCALSIAVMYFPSILLDGKKSAHLLDDPDTFWKFMYHDRRDFVLKHLKQDQDYADRLLEAVKELVEVSHKLDQYPLPR